MAIVSSQVFFLFTSYGKLSPKLYNIHLPVLISTILNIMDAARTVQVCIFNICVSLWTVFIRILTDFLLYVLYRKFCNSNGDFS